MFAFILSGPMALFAFNFRVFPITVSGVMVKSKIIYSQGSAVQVGNLGWAH